MYYKVLFYLIIIICLYLFNIYIKIDKLNKISIKFLIDNYYILKDVEIDSSTILDSLTNFLKIPFKNDIFLDQIHEGSLYSNYIYKIYPKLGIKMLDKIYWYNFFKNNNIAHPEMIGYNRNNRIHMISKFNLSKEYICKPIIGTCGFKIKKVKGNQILDILKNNKNTLIQELLIDCNVDTSRHFRFVTLYDGSKFILWLMKTNSKKIIASNHANGGTVKLCENFLCHDLGYLEQQKLNSFMEKLRIVHKNKFPQILAIGWDIMIDCKHKQNIKVYCLEGNICNSVWFYPDYDSPEIINKFKKITYDFYRKKLNIKL